MTARELNWGAVFFDPTSMSEDGPSFASSKLWFHPYRPPVVLVLLVIFATGFILSKGPRIIADMLVNLEFPFLTFSASHSQCSFQPPPKAMSTCP